MKPNLRIYEALATLTRSHAHVRWVLCTTLLALILLVGTLTRGFLDAAANVDDAEKMAQRTRVKNYIDANGETTAKMLRTQLVWDDAYKAVGEGFDRAWADQYIGFFFTKSARFDEAMLVRPDGHPVATWRGGVAAKLDQPTDWIDDLLRRGRFDGHAKDYRRYGGGLWPLDANESLLVRRSSSVVRWRGRQMIATAVSVMPDWHYELLKNEPNVVIVFSPIDAAFLKRMARDLALGAPRLTAEAPAGERINGLQLHGPDGIQAGWLRWATVPFNQNLRDEVQPLFVYFLLFLTALIGGIGLMLVTFWRALRAVEQNEAEAQHQAMHDMLTGLPNRAGFMATLNGALEALDRADPKQAIQIAFFDIDRFKLVNDTMGHHVGDELVRAVGARFRAELDSADFVARLGGDEFVVMRSGGGAEAGAAELGQAIRSVVARPFEICGQRLDITVSCGLACAPDHAAEAGKLLQFADTAMYAAKQSGRGAWRIFSLAMAASIHRRRAIEVGLRAAIGTDRLSLAYQPIVATKSGAIVGAEALLRWDDPELGTIDPAEFIPIAEQCGLMPPLGAWVIRQAFAESRAWPRLPLAINLSPKQTCEPNFLADLMDLAEQFTVNPAAITFEISEGAVQAPSAELGTVLDQLRERGFRIALDDFGSLHSNISTIRSRHFDQIKIDREIIRLIDTDLDAFATLKAIVSLAKVMRKSALAEGVENAEQRRMVQAAGCDLIQGRIFWPALPASAIEALTEGADLKALDLDQAGNSRQAG